MKSAYSLFAGCILLLVLVFPFVLHADWILVDDFEDYGVGTYTPADGNMLYPLASNGALGQTDILTGIEGIGGEKAAWFWFGVQNLGGDVFHQIPLSPEIPVNELGTLYFRIWQSVKDLNWHVMISKVTAGEEPQNTAIYGNQAAILRYNQMEPEGSLYAYGGGYLLPQPLFSPEPGNWYEYWIILDNAYDEEDPSDAGGYFIYRKGPDEPRATLMVWGTDQPRSKLPMRNPTVASLKSIVLLQNEVDGPNTWLIDDIYMTLGACLSDPRNGEPGRTWYQYPLIGDDADTLGWLDWLYVAEDPWAWSYLLESWLYVPGTPEARGGWVFVAR